MEKRTLTHNRLNKWKQTDNERQTNAQERRLNAFLNRLNGQQTFLNGWG